MWRHRSSPVRRNRVRAIAGAIALVAATALWLQPAAALNEVYVPDTTFSGCAASPVAPAPSGTVTCQPSSPTLAFPGVLSVAAATPNISGTLTSGQTFEHAATVNILSSGISALSVAAPNDEGVACGVITALVDFNGDQIGDAPYRLLALTGVTISGGVVTTDRGIAQSPVSAGAGGTWNLRLSVQYLGGGFYNVSCIATGTQNWTLTGSYFLGSDTIAVGTVSARNVSVFNIAGQGLPTSSGTALAEFTNAGFNTAPAPASVLIDPSGFVYQAGNTAIRIPGAAVVLQRFDGANWQFMNPIADAASMDPDVNPEFTNATGQYKWDVAAGTYRVIVSKTGCASLTSDPVVVLEPVLDLNVGLTCTDADADGVMDWRETNSLVYFDADNIGTSPLKSDTDSDGLTDGAEIALGTNPVDADGDDDSVLDGADNCVFIVNGLQQNADGNFIDLPPTLAYDDATLANSDTFGDACDSDDDNDGRSDDDETNGTGCGAFVTPTDPLKLDSDNDFITDGAECALGSNPASAASKPTFAQCTAAHPGDADGDGLPAAREFCNYGTSDTSTNTDGDACGDGREIASINADLIVSSIDLNQIASAFGSVSANANYVANLDFTRDGNINAIDLSQTAQRFGACP